MRTFTYHREIGLPRGTTNVPRQVIQPQYSEHAMSAAHSDRYGVIDLPRTLDLRQTVLIELTTDSHNTYVKGLWRIPYNDTFDLCVVVTADWTVKTVWLNSVKDKHHTLDRARYDTPRK